jgi:hypothetical protein
MRSVAITLALPRRAACADICPIMPRPITTTSSLGSSRVIRTPCRETPAMWYSDAPARSTPAGTFVTAVRSTTRYAECDAWHGPGYLWFGSEKRVPSAKTWSPTARSSTDDPTSSTIPAA